MGEVVELGPGAADLGWQTGTRVAGTSHAGCGYCRLCVARRYNLCETSATSVTASTATTPRARTPTTWSSVKSVFAVPDSLSDEEAAMLDPRSPCTPSSAAARRPATPWR